MSIAEDQEPFVTAAVGTPKHRRRRLLGIVLAIATAQYTVVTILVGASVAGVLRYLVTPQIIAQFEAIAAALKH